jgi:hypothetical protein
MVVVVLGNRLEIYTLATIVLETGQASIFKRLPSTTTRTSSCRPEIKHTRKHLSMVDSLSVY